MIMVKHNYVHMYVRFKRNNRNKLEEEIKAYAISALSRSYFSWVVVSPQICTMLSLLLVSQRL